MALFQNPRKGKPIGVTVDGAYLAERLEQLIAEQQETNRLLAQLLERPTAPSRS
jgi:hypothetical protein